MEASMEDDAAVGKVLVRAQAAAGRGDWQEAYDLLAAVHAEAPLAGSTLAFFADTAYATGHLDVTISAWERAHTDSLRAGDSITAAGAAVRVALHLLFDTALMAPIRGWARRAERLLEGYQDTPIHAWLAVVRSYERLLSGDFDAARRWAGEAIAVGSTQAPAAAAIGRVAEARTLILQGDVAAGLELLDEAAVVTVSGELDPISTGIVYCELVCTLQGLAQYDLAEEWTAAMERWHHGQPVGSVHGRCRVHRAEILRLRGATAEAEQQALLACAELRPYLRRELGWPLTELGRIRLQRGDLVGAEEAFLAAHEAGWDPQPGLALVRLAQGDVALAAASIRDALMHPLNVPSKELPPNSGLRQAPLLAAETEIALAAGDLERARSAAAELEQVAATFGSRALTASALMARGRVGLAEGDAAQACIDFEAALQIWADVGAPYETARARVALAHACRACGNEERALREFQSAQLSFERIDALIDLDLASRAYHDVAAAKQYGTRPRAAVEATPVAGEQRFRREGDYWSVTFDGRTVRLRDLKGLRYLARLLGEPGREIHVFDLVAAERGAGPRLSQRAEPGLVAGGSFDAGELLDREARDAYRRRLAEIADDIEDARARGDSERAAQAAAERDFLVRELTRAFGLGGRSRRAGSSSERARASVTRALRQALARVSEHHPSLGQHLDVAIRTGTCCSYVPDPRVTTAWLVDSS
jgi:tetratricopeptide (TPR) repeat protein